VRCLLCPAGLAPSCRSLGLVPPPCFRFAADPNDDEAGTRERVTDLHQNRRNWLHVLGDGNYRWRRAVRHGSSPSPLPPLCVPCSRPCGAALQVKLWKKDTRERQTFHFFNQLMTGLRFLHNEGRAVCPPRALLPPCSAVMLNPTGGEPPRPAAPSGQLQVPG